MDTNLNYAIFFVVGAILFMLAMSYSYDTKSSHSKRITNILWIIANVFMLIGIIGEFSLRKDVLIPAILVILGNYSMWHRVRKSIDKTIE